MSVIIDGSAGVTTNAGGSVNPSTNVDGINYSCRAWVNFNGTGTVAIRASGNVTSITDNGAGDYTVNFTTAMTDTNYSFFGSAGQTAAASVPAMVGINRDNFLYSTTAIRLFNITGAGALPDSLYLNVCIFR
jgi:hypothetical protein